mgnify:CR=1 FL=1
MKEIRIEKITLNVGTGKPGSDLEKAKILLNKITGLKPAETRTMKRIPGWGLRPNLVIGCKVTVRGKNAVELVQTLLKARDSEVSSRAFDKNGNFAFGIKEYLDVPTLNYIPEVGIIGFEVAVTLERKGFRVKRRSLKTRSIPARHRISKEQGIEFAKKSLGVIITDRDEEAEE